MIAILNRKIKAVELFRPVSVPCGGVVNVVSDHSMGRSEGKISISSKLHHGIFRDNTSHTLEKFNQILPKLNKLLINVVLI